MRLRLTDPGFSFFSCQKSHLVKLMKPACQAGRGKEQGNVNRPSLEGEGNVVLGNEVSP